MCAAVEYLFLKCHARSLQRLGRWVGVIMVAEL